MASMGVLKKAPMFEPVLLTMSLMRRQHDHWLDHCGVQVSHCSESVKISTYFCSSSRKVICHHQYFHLVLISFTIKSLLCQFSLVSDKLEMFRDAVHSTLCPQKCPEPDPSHQCHGNIFSLLGPNNSQLHSTKSNYYRFLCW